MKPFSAGDREDAALFDSLQESQLPWPLLNPYHFDRPLAPMVAARLEGRQSPKIAEVLEQVRAAQSLGEVLLVEGAGGLMVPVAEGYSILDLVAELNPRVLLVAPDRLGVINEVRLSLRALHSCRVRNCAVLLVAQEQPDLASQTNAEVLGELCSGTPIVRVPRVQMPAGMVRVDAIKKAAKNFQIVLAQISELITLVGQSEGCEVAGKRRKGE